MSLSSSFATSRRSYTSARSSSLLSSDGRLWYFKLVAKNHPLDDSSTVAAADSERGGSSKNVRALLDDFSLESLGSLAMIVCMTDPAGRHLFSVFRTVAEFYNFINSLSEDHRATRCFFEVCFTGRPQRLRFDIDFEHGTEEEAERVLGDILGACEKTFVDLRSPLRSLEEDLVLCTSHGPTKMSYHLVFTHCYVNRAEEAKSFYSLVVRKMQPEHQVYVDLSVYKRTQQFRILGFSKVGSNRPKVCPIVWKYRIPQIQEQDETATAPDRIVQIDTSRVRSSLNPYTLLCRTLISHVDCGFPIAVPVESTVSNSSSIISSGGAPSESIRSILRFATERMEHFPFEYVGCSENQTLILLRRLSSSLCPTCDRIHEHENPFLRCVWKGDERFEILFDCRRASLMAAKKQHTIGVIALPELRVIVAKAAFEQAMESSSSTTSAVVSSSSSSVAAAAAGPTGIDKWRQETMRRAVESTKKRSPVAAHPATIPAHPSILDMLRKAEKKSSSSGDTRNHDSQVVIIQEDPSSADHARDASSADHARDASSAGSANPAIVPPSRASSASNAIRRDQPVTRGSESTLNDSEEQVEHAPETQRWKDERVHSERLRSTMLRVTSTEQKNLDKKIQKLTNLNSSDPEKRYFAASISTPMLSAFWKLPGRGTSGSGGSGSSGSNVAKRS